MKIKLLMIGKTTDSKLQTLIEDYSGRLKHYANFEMVVVPELKNTKNLSFELQKEKEGELLLSKVEPNDDVILLDDKGRQFSSMEFADFISKKMLAASRGIVFVVGGPYGFAPSVYERANSKLSLSAMTFSHQMIRLIFAEQLYRAMTILKGEPYHHE